MFKFVTAVAAALILSATPAFADGIGIFNSQTIVSQTEPSKAAQKLLQSKFGSERSQMEKQEKSLQSQYESFQKQAATLSQKAREEKQIEILRKSREFEEKRRDFAIRVEREDANLRQTMGKILFEASANVAKRNKLDLVLDANAGVIMYADPSMDLTDDMIKEVNKIWKSMGSKFPAAEKKSNK